MNAAFLTIWISRRGGGIVNSTRRLAQELAETDEVSVEIFSSRDSFAGEDGPSWLPLVPRTLPASGPASFGYTKDLHRLLLKSGPDIVRVDGLWTYSSIASLQHYQATGRPYMVAPHGMLDGWALRHSRWKKRVAGMSFENKHLRHATCLHALSEAEAQSFRDYGLKNPICVLPNGVDLPVVADGSDRPTNVFAEAAQGRKVLLYLGRLHPKKGLINLVKSWGQVRKMDPTGKAGEWMLAIVGWDQLGHENELRRLSADLGLENSIYFPGARFGAEKEACYRDADAFILPSFSEGLPMAVLEAWAHAKPVLMTSACHLPEGFAASAALRIEPEVDSINGSLRELFQMSGTDRQAMGNQGFDLVKRRFVWPRIAAEMAGVFSWMKGGGPRPVSVEDARFL